MRTQSATQVNLQLLVAPEAPGPLLNLCRTVQLWCLALASTLAFLLSCKSASTTLSFSVQLCKYGVQAVPRLSR